MNQDIAVLFSNQGIVVFLLVLSRITGMLATAPLFSTFPIPMMVKACMSALIGFIIFPFVFATSHIQMPHDLIMMSVLVLKEVMVGVLIGFSANLIFIGIEIGGQLLAIQMGLSIAETLDPITRQNVPIVGQFYLFMACILFIFLNGHHWLITCVYGSYHSIPIGFNFEFSSALVEKILLFSSQLFSIAFSIVMPVFALLFIIDIALAVVSKMMPQMNIFMVGLPFKIYIGIILMSIFITTTAGYLTGLIQTLLESLRGIFT